MENQRIQNQDHNQFYKISQEYTQNIACVKHPKEFIAFISLENESKDKIMCQKCINEQQKLNHQYQSLPDFLENLLKIVCPSQNSDQQYLKDIYSQKQKEQNGEISEIKFIKQTLDGNYFLQKQLIMRNGVSKIKANYENQLNELIQNYADSMQEMFTSSMDRLYEMIMDIYEKQQHYLSSDESDNSLLQKQIVALNLLIDYQQAQKQNNINQKGETQPFDLNLKIQNLQNGFYQLDEIELSFQNIINYINHFFGNYMDQVQQTIDNSKKDFEENLKVIKERFGESYLDNFNIQKEQFKNDIKEMFPNIDLNEFIKNQKMSFYDQQTENEDVNTLGEDNYQQKGLQKQNLIPQSYVPKIIAQTKPFKKQNLPKNSIQISTNTEKDQENQIDQIKKEQINSPVSSKQDMDFLKLSPRNYQPNKNQNFQQQIKSFFKINTLFRDPMQDQKDLQNSINKQIYKQQNDQDLSLSQKALNSLKEKNHLEFLEDTQNLYYNNDKSGPKLNQIGSSNNQQSKQLKQLENIVKNNSFNNEFNNNGNNERMSVPSSLDASQSLSQSQQSQFFENQFNNNNNSYTNLNNNLNNKLTHKGTSFIQKIFGSHNRDLMNRSAHLMIKTENNLNFNINSNLNTENSMLNSGGARSCLNGSVSQQNLRHIPKSINLSQFGSDSKVKGYLEEAIKQKKVDKVLIKKQYEKKSNHSQSSHQLQQNYGTSLLSALENTNCRLNNKIQEQFQNLEKSR